MDGEISLGGVVVASLGCWRVTHLLWGEDGPWGAFARLRAASAGNVVGRTLDCFYCLAVWVALPFAAVVADAWRGGVLAWLAISGAAILLERATAERGAPPAPWREEDPVEPN